jgi:hypothetical protein
MASKRRRVHLPVVSDADHATDLQLGGKKPRWSPEMVRDRAAPIAEEFETREQWIRVRNAWALRGSWEPRTDVPRTRGECPDYRPCDRIRCAMHLWIDLEPTGRPGLARVPRDAKGRTLAVAGDMANGERSKARIDNSAPWLEHPLRPSCALDLADRGPSDNLKLATATGRHRTLVARIVRRAVQSLALRGVNTEDLMRLVKEK